MSAARSLRGTARNWSNSVETSDLAWENGHPLMKGEPFVVECDRGTSEGHRLWRRIRTRRVMPIIMIALGLSAADAYSHDAAMLDSIPSAHGGVVRMAGPYHIELVLEPSSSRPVRRVRIYLQNHAFVGMPSKELTGVVTLMFYTVSVAIPLIPDGPESLGGSGSFLDDPALKLAVSLTDKDGQVFSTIFSPFVGHRGLPR
jgi:hypothetical protein